MSNYGIFDISNWFLSKESMTHKKLQKLCYYAQAWHCALFNGEPLTDDRFEAWVHGPVCPTLYSRYAGLGWSLIAKKENLLGAFKDEDEELLEAVYDLYKDFDGDQLESITHREDPWLNQRVGLRPFEPSNNVISIDDMKQYYLSLYEKGQND